MGTQYYNLGNKFVVLSADGILVDSKGASGKNRRTVRPDKITADASVALAVYRIARARNDPNSQLMMKSFDIGSLLGLSEQQRKVVELASGAIGSISSVVGYVQAGIKVLEILGVMESKEDKIFAELEKINQKLDVILERIEETNRHIFALWHSNRGAFLAEAWADMSHALTVMREFVESKGDRNSEYWNSRFALAEQASETALSRIIGSPIEGYCDGSYWRRPNVRSIVGYDTWHYGGKPDGRPFFEASRLDFRPDGAGAVWDYRWMLPYLAATIVARMLVLSIARPRSIITGQVHPTTRIEGERVVAALDTMKQNILDAIHMKTYQTEHEVGMWYHQRWAMIGSVCLATGYLEVIDTGYAMQNILQPLLKLKNGEVTEDTLGVDIAPELVRMGHDEVARRNGRAEWEFLYRAQAEYAKSKILAHSPYHEICALQTSIGDMLKPKRGVGMQKPEVIVAINVAQRHFTTLSSQEKEKKVAEAARLPIKLDKNGTLAGGAKAFYSKILKR